MNKGDAHWPELHAPTWTLRVGRGLRRVSYDTDEDGLFLPKNVNVRDVPLTISRSTVPISSGWRT